MAEEVVISIEETNKLREKLGLKPLKVTSGGGRKPSGGAPTGGGQPEDKGSQGNGAPSPGPEDLKKRLKGIREERLNEQKNEEAVAALGEKRSEEDDDALAWIRKSRKLEKTKREREKEEFLRVQKALLEQEEFDEDGEGSSTPRKYTEKDLRGLKIGHGTDMIQEGHQTILTLKDQDVLDEGGELNEKEDVLEDTGLAQQEKHDEAVRRSKAKNKYDESAQGGILSKYDESAPSTSHFMELDGSGQIDQEKLARQEEMRRKLKDGINFGKLEESADPMKKVLDDFWTPDEMSSLQQAAGQKKRRRKKKKNVRMRRTDIDALEVQADQAQAGKGDEVHHGQRGGGAETGASSSGKQAEAYLQEQARRDAAYSEAAVKAAKATEDVLGPQKNARDPLNPAADFGDGDDGDDNDFIKSLSKARNAALLKQRRQGDMGASSVASQVKKFAQKGEASMVDGEETLYKGEVFTEAGEFCNSIKAEEQRVASREEDSPLPMPAEEGHRQSDATDMEEDNGKGEEAQGASTSNGGDGVLAESRLDKGIGSALRLLQGRGELRETVRWAGRTNDKKFNNVRDVVESYNDETQFAQDIENALTRKDEFGRVMTPKEAFRQLCYKFHGKPASKNKQEKRIKKYLEEQKMMEMTTGDTPLNTMDRLKDFQKHSSTPYLVLTGKIKPGQSSDPHSGFALEKDDFKMPSASSPNPEQANEPGDKPSRGKKRKQ
mmetsp:Transcript_2661/g.6347  ORF Transcript_2661/g.6347 Transcript_2661/m.6347 type:complete len:720 (-) Transcript_2661:993-3152(-)|eukprot:CAMPEP_0198237718 /NCGR_PEP_ID=MMETSP1446-20131203/3511_1 /TAXON_ID=1461542 ORGANISM="Unidentified sp, Strain CCMP2111" /NCGR_SAMPLE_ID=MMETSP1446 /ASSEMBLY_ACC=CAM_ASM_001112 /LENGTH=719 /DNA_ID=CAMNT_0043919953 /DNA_START=247 /DNA_END=2406 /DNA_ORIENTATION=+